VTRSEADVLAARYRDLAQLVAAGNGYAALLESVKVQRSLDRLVRRAVVEARKKGATWEQIGAVYGITKQAAQQRFGKI
jgi:hypothetical protein